MSTYSNSKPIITSCSVLLPEIVVHDAYIGERSENNIKCVVVHNDFGRKNRTTRYNFLPRYTSDFLSFIVVEPFNYLRPLSISSTAAACGRVSL